MQPKNIKKNLLLAIHSRHSCRAMASDKRDLLHGDFGCRCCRERNRTTKLDLDSKLITQNVTWKEFGVLFRPSGFLHEQPVLVSTSKLKPLQPPYDVRAVNARGKIGKTWLIHLMLRLAWALLIQHRFRSLPALARCNLKLGLHSRLFLHPHVCMACSRGTSKQLFCAVLESLRSSLLTTRTAIELSRAKLL